MHTVWSRRRIPGACARHLAVRLHPPPACTGAGRRQREHPRVVKLHGAALVAVVVAPPQAWTAGCACAPAPHPTATAASAPPPNRSTSVSEIATAAAASRLLGASPETESDTASTVAASLGRSFPIAAPAVRRACRTPSSPGVLRYSDGGRRKGEQFILHDARCCARAQPEWPPRRITRKPALVVRRRRSTRASSRKAALWPRGTQARGQCSHGEPACC